MSISRYNRVYINGDLVVNDNTGTTQFMVESNDKVNCREIEVDMDPIPDYVFEEDYPLMSLEELQTYIKTHKRLLNIPSAAEHGERGSVALGEMNRLLLEKVEELTLMALSNSGSAVDKIFDDEAYNFNPFGIPFPLHPKLQKRNSRRPLRRSPLLSY